MGEPELKQIESINRLLHPFFLYIFLHSRTMFGTREHSMRSVLVRPDGNIEVFQLEGGNTGRDVLHTLVGGYFQWLKITECLYMVVNADATPDTDLFLPNPLAAKAVQRLAGESERHPIAGSVVFATFDSLGKQKDFSVETARQLGWTSIVSEL